MSKQNKAPDVAKAVNKLVHKEGSSDIDQAYSDLFNQDSAPNQLPESIFVDKFLPFFAGKVHDDRSMNITTHWVAVAGSPMNPVDVTDNSTGKVLYTVPSLMSTDFLRTSENLRGRKFSEIFVNARNQANRLPVLGERVLGAQSADKLSKMKVEPEKTDKDRWNQIFNRYGIEHPKTKTGVATDNQNNGSDDLVFDDE